MATLRSDHAHEGTHSVQIAVYLCHSDQKMLDRLQAALGVSDKLTNRRSITISKLIRLAYAESFPPKVARQR